MENQNQGRRKKLSKFTEMDPITLPQRGLRPPPTVALALSSRQETERPTEATRTRVRKHPAGLRPSRTALLTVKMLFSRQEIERPTEATRTRVRKHPVGLRPCRTDNYCCPRPIQQSSRPTTTAMVTNPITTAGRRQCRWARRFSRANRTNSPLVRANNSSVFSSDCARLGDAPVPLAGASVGD